MVNEVLNQLKAVDFEILMKYSKRSNKLFNIELPMLIYFSYRFVKIDLPELLSSGNIEEILKLICDEKNIEYNQQSNITASELISFVLWLKDEIEIVQRLEQEHLSSPPDNDMIAAGVHELNELGEINVIDQLAGGDILKWELIEQLPYYKVFDKLKKNTVEAKVNKEYQKIISKKK